MVVIISTSLAIVKGFRFQINQTEPFETYPAIFYRNTAGYYITRSKIGYSLLLSFDSLSDFVTYLVFLVVNFVLDIVLFWRVRVTLREKMKKFKLDEKTQKMREKENAETVNRIVRLVLLNAFVSLLCKIPVAIVSLNDLRLIFVINFFEQFDNLYMKILFEFPYSMRLLCHLDNICAIFLDFGHFLYYFSITISIMFYYSFDFKFKYVFQVLLKRNNKNTAKK